MSPALNPTFDYEDAIAGPVVGLDEVGRGPLAGPVVAACVYIPDKVRSHPFVSDLRDSKKLSKVKLKILNALIHEHCHVSIAAHSPEEIDEMNILQASLSAMQRACSALKGVQPVHALIDGNRVPKNLPCSAEAVIKGDSKSKSIAAASIVAKFYRDEFMVRLAKDYPVYGWESNVGYPSAQHRNAIWEHGITPHHRKSYAPVKVFLSSLNARNTAL